MTEPTLTDLRETARMIVDCDIADNRIALARAFLSLTDPTPLTAEHCREAGMTEDPESAIDLKGVGIDFVYMFDTDRGDVRIECYNPTLGQLRLALLQENRDGE